MVMHSVFTVAKSFFTLLVLRYMAVRQLKEHSVWHIKYYMVACIHFHFIMYSHIAYHCLPFFVPSLLLLCK